MAEAELMPVGAVVVGRRVRQNPQEYLLPLRESIRKVGLLNPVVVNGRNELVAGFRRLEAVKALGWTDIPVRRIATLDDALAALTAERDENTCRTGMSMSELVELGRAIEALEKPESAKRKKEGGRAGGKASGKLPEASSGDTRDKVAAALGVSGKTFEKAKVVVEAAEQDPEAFAPVVKEMDRTGKVDPAFRKVRKSQPKPTAEPGPSLLDVCRLILDRATPHEDSVIVRMTPAEFEAFRQVIAATEKK